MTWNDIEKHLALFTQSFSGCSESTYYSADREYDKIFHNLCKCQDSSVTASMWFQVIPRSQLVPVHGDHMVEEYWPTSPTPLSHWRNLFSNSSAIHFFSSGSAKLRVPREPQYCAYALLGPHYCPLAYYGSPDF